MNKNIYTIKLDSYENYNLKKNTLSDYIKNNHNFSFRGNNSNRYNNYYNNSSKKSNVQFSSLNKIINVNLKKMYIDCESGVTMETIFDYLFNLKEGNYGLKMTTDTLDMTVGGAISGIGVHGNMHKVGLFHESMIDMDILLNDGRIIYCDKHTNEMLFNAIPNSYGTIGKILRAKLEITKIKPYLKVSVIKFDSVSKFLDNLSIHSNKKIYDYIFCLIFKSDEIYLILMKYTNKPKNIISFKKYNTFYKFIKYNKDFFINSREGLFIFEADWYWNIPDNIILKFFLPEEMRKIKLYKQAAEIYKKINFTKNNKNNHTFIQDWEIEYEKSNYFLSTMLNKIEPYMNNKPLCIFPLISKTNSYFYPLKKNKLYINIGSYSILNNNDNNYTKIFDKLLYKLDGIKMLYSIHYFSKKEFDKIYNGELYNKIKNIYDPKYKLGNLYEKTKS